MYIAFNSKHHFLKTTGKVLELLQHLNINTLYFSKFVHVCKSLSGVGRCFF